MGGTTFEQYASGVDVKSAFQQAHEAAGHEHGHGGYSGSLAEKDSFVIITHTPLLEGEAWALADQLIQANDPRICDKWGPAGAIPVVSTTRTVTVSGFEYYHDHNHRDYSAIQPDLLAAITPLVKLRRGETIQSVRLTSYTPQRSGAAAVARYSSCQAQVVINKPPSTRSVSATFTLPAGLGYDQQSKEIQAQVDQLKLKAGESAISWNIVKNTQGKATVTATAPKGATTTRYIVKGSTRHGAWETGFASQAEARKWATDAMNDEQFHWRDTETWEIEGITRRADGQPLVQLERRVGKRVVEVAVEVKLASVSAPANPDGWLFFGWASS